MELTLGVLADAGTWCCTSTMLDKELVEHRVRNEGESFLTITLPSFAKQFESCLESGVVTSVSFEGFAPLKRKAIPKFLSGLLGLIFDPVSGLLLDEPNITAIFFVRQITLLHKKVLLDCTTEREAAAYEKFIQCENELTATFLALDPGLLGSFGRVADVLWSIDLSHIDRKVYDGDHTPKHGPGVTADRFFGNEKFDCTIWHRRLDEYFPAEDFRIPNYGFWRVLDDVEFVEPGAEQPVKVISVPKTLKTPRIIAVEPTCMQYAQQSLMEVIVDQLEGSDILNGSIGFTDQVPNQDAARKGSIDGSLATIDLSEASDRVSNQLVQRMLKNFPSFAGAVQSCRSTRADVPGIGVVPLSKFASMGSALCFPMEAMVFLTIIMLSFEQELNKPLTLSAIISILAAGHVRVYGDDIIVPEHMVRPVTQNLEAFGLKVNRNKTFVSKSSRFRESCGRDYYAGQDVSVTYCRRVLPESLGNAAEMISAVSLRNQLYKAGLWNTAMYLDDKLGDIVNIPTVLETSPIIGRHSFMGYETQRMCANLHRPLVKGMMIKTRPKRSPITGEGALMKFFLKRGRDPILDPKHLERYGRPDSVDIKIRWGSST